jgi:hypothetical protein
MKASTYVFLTHRVKTSEKTAGAEPKQSDNVLAPIVTSTAADITMKLPKVAQQLMYYTVK